MESCNARFFTFGFHIVARCHQTAEGTFQRHRWSLLLVIFWLFFTSGAYLLIFNIGVHRIKITKFIFWSQSQTAGFSVINFCSLLNPMTERINLTSTFSYHLFDQIFGSDITKLSRCICLIHVYLIIINIYLH